MVRRTVPFVQEAVLGTAAFLLLVPQVPAGDRVHAANRPTIQAQSAPAPLVRPVTRSVSVRVVASAAVLPPQPAPEQFTVDLRGPDGQVRHFPVEGGRDAIQVQQVVLRPGESLTIHWLVVRK